MKKFTVIVVLALLLMVFAVPTASAASPASSGYWYTVQYGDTLSGIAYYHGVKLSQLIYVNHISNPDHIYYGQSLWIPGYGDYGHAGQYHKVKKGETLSGIAYYYGVSVWALAKANNIYNLDHIYYGQHLHIPHGY